MTKDKIKCHNCGHENDYTASDCPTHCKECYAEMCPRCGGPLDDDESYVYYCGCGCSSCGWSHCGGCE